MCVTQISTYAGMGGAGTGRCWEGLAGTAVEEAPEVLETPVITGLCCGDRPASLWSLAEEEQRDETAPVRLGLPPRHRRSLRTRLLPRLVVEKRVGRLPGNCLGTKFEHREPFVRPQGRSRVRIG